MRREEGHACRPCQEMITKVSSPTLHKSILKYQVCMISVRQVKSSALAPGMVSGRPRLTLWRFEPTIARLETADGEVGGYAGTRDKIIAALEVAGVEFIAENGGGGWGAAEKGGGLECDVSAELVALAAIDPARWLRTQLLAAGAGGSLECATGQRGAGQGSQDHLGGGGPGAK